MGVIYSNLSFTWLSWFHDLDCECNRVNLVASICYHVNIYQKVLFFRFFCPFIFLVSFFSFFKIIFFIFLSYNYVKSKLQRKKILKPLDSITMIADLINQASKPGSIKYFLVLFKKNCNAEIFFNASSLFWIFLHDMFRFGFYWINWFWFVFIMFFYHLDFFLKFKSYFYQLYSLQARSN